MSVTFLYITHKREKCKYNIKSVHVRQCVVNVIDNKVSTHQAGIHTLEMVPEHESIKAGLFNRVQNAYLWNVAVVMHVQIGKHSLLMCPAS